jgi:hypothetical protein
MSWRLKSNRDPRSRQVARSKERIIRGERGGWLGRRGGGWTFEETIARVAQPSYFLEHKAFSCYTYS